MIRKIISEQVIGQTTVSPQMGPNIPPPIAPPGSNVSNISPATSMGAGGGSSPMSADGYTVAELVQLAQSNGAPPIVVSCLRKLDQMLNQRNPNMTAVSRQANAILSSVHTRGVKQTLMEKKKWWETWWGKIIIGFLGGFAAAAGSALGGSIIDERSRKPKRKYRHIRK